MDPRLLALRYRDLLAPVRLVVLDVDGVLTDGSIFYVGGDVGWTRRFDVRDGFGVKTLLRAGMHVAALSADDNPAMRDRLKNMGIEEAHFGSEDKLASFAAIQERFEVDDAATLFMGDELYDVPLIAQAGVGVSVPGACVEAREVADYITARPGGRGAVREVCDLLRYAQDLPVEVRR